MIEKKWRQLLLVSVKNSRGPTLKEEDKGIVTREERGLTKANISVECFTICKMGRIYWVNKVFNIGKTFLK